MYPLLLIALFGSALHGASSQSSLRVQPHVYADSRGQEPNTQMIGLARARFSEAALHPRWNVLFHLEGETLGRRDVSLDLDEAWYRFSLFETDAVTLGRIHPFAISNHPEAFHPWSLLAQQDPQNLGVQLGYGYSDAGNIPSPILMGWIGAHYWNDRFHTASFQWGFSATPFFLPSMGSEVVMYKDAAASTSRFGRRPPGSVLLDGREYPIRYEVDRSRVFEDIVLQPQVIAQVKLQNRESQNPELENWITFQRSPSPSPSFKSQEFLIVRPDSIEAFAKVKPEFKPRVFGSETLKWNFDQSDLKSNVFGSLTISESNTWGWEVGTASRYHRLSLLEERRFAPTENAISSSEVSYTELLGQADVMVPFGSLTVYSGIKMHLARKDYWLRSGISLPIMRHATLDTGVDIFSGDEGTYFGEWRTNNRASLVLLWEIDAE